MNTFCKYSVIKLQVTYKKSEEQVILEDKKGKILERTGEMEEKILSQNVLQPLISEATIIQVQLNTQLS